MPRYDYDDYDRYDEYDEEPETESTGGHRTDYRVARKSRSVWCSMAHERVRVEVGDLVKVSTYFSYNTEHHPDEPHVRTGYHTSEQRIAFGPNHAANEVGRGNWARSKKGSYEAYHGTLPQAAQERDLIRQDIALVASGKLGQITREDVQALVEDAQAWTEAWGVEFSWPKGHRTPKRMLQAIEQREEREARVAEHNEVCRAAPGTTVQYQGRTYTKGSRFTKLIMHSNLEYAGGAGDCTAEGRFHLHAPEGADYPSLTPAFGRYAPRHY